MKKLILCFLLAASVASAHAGQRSFIYGRILSVTSTGVLISCASARHSHPTGSYDLADSGNQIVHVTADPKTLFAILSKLPDTTIHAGDKDTVMLSALAQGEYTYTTVLRVQNTVPNLVSPEAIAHYSVVTLIDPNNPPKPSGTPEMKLPRYNL
jgi:hypothetical protein